MQQLKSSSERTINWNKYQSKVTIQEPKSYLDYLIDPGFQGVNRHFVVKDFDTSFKITTDWTVQTKYYVPTVEIKDYNVMIDGQNFSDQPLKNNLRTYDKIWNIGNGQGDNCTTNCLFNYFNYFFTLPKAIQQINLTGNPARQQNAMQHCFSFLKKRNKPF